MSNPGLDKRRRWLWGACLLACFSASGARSQAPPIQASSAGADSIEVELRRAADEIRVAPRVDAEYDYIMTARVRLLFFWAGKDDVGGGYIRRGVSAENPSTENVFQLVMGSDPAKAPRAINRWGAVSELVQRARLGGAPESSTFFGFMKVSKGNSVSEMQKELENEKQGGAFLFSAILNQADRSGSLAKTVPFASDSDFNIHQLDQAEPVVFDRLEGSEGKIRTTDPSQFRSCGRPQGFLSSAAELVDDSLEGRRPPIAICYFYNGELFRLTLTRVSPVGHESVRLSLTQTSQPYVREYQNLLLAHIENFNVTTQRGSTFDLLLGTKGDLRGVPVRISYQPNWWFQVILNLKTQEDSRLAGIR